MANPFSLPFQFNNKSISAWLGQLKSSDVVLTSKAIYKVLAILRREHNKIAPAELNLVVMRLTPVVMYVSDFLEKIVFKQPKSAELGQFILHHLAFLQLQLATQAQQSSQKVLQLNYAVQLITIAFKYSAYCYQQPSRELWEAVSACYELAVKAGLLNVTVAKPLQVFEALPKVSLALKRLLLFCLANPYAFTREDIQTLFDFCTQNCHLVNFVEPGSPVINHTFCWDLDNRFQAIYAKPVKLPERHVLFHAYALLHTEQNSEVAVSAGVAFIAHFNYHKELLEGTQFALSRNYIVVSGATQVFEFFARHIRDYGVSMANTPPLVKDLNFSSLVLAEKSAHKGKWQQLEKVSSVDIWQQADQDLEANKALKFGAMKLSRSSQTLFSVAEVMIVKLQVGELFIAYDASLKPVLGQVYCIEMNAYNTVQKAVVGLFKGKVSVLVQQQSFIKTDALLVEHERGAQLFLTAGKYALGTVLEFEGCQVVLNKVLGLSPKFVRYAVSIRDV